MVYYYTSKNVKTLRELIIDYRTSVEKSPYEYLKEFVENCPNSMDEEKICWIIETFANIQRHIHFLNTISSSVSEELSDEDYDYFLILFHAIIFQITPKYTQLLYKSLFNLSKSLLLVITTFLCRDYFLTIISQVAQADYDTIFVSEQILSPLASWQPYIIKMADNYAEYVEKVRRQNVKQPTIPISPKVLNRKNKKKFGLKEILPTTPQNSFNSKAKVMLTKDVIDKKLKKNHDDNKRKAMQLLNSIKKNNLHFALVNPHICQNTSDINILNVHKSSLPKIIQKPLIKETSTTVKRTNKRIELAEQEEIQWLQDLMNNCQNTMKAEILELNDRQEREKERLLDIERKHLLGQISYEEAIIAKKKLLEGNKQKYSDFLKEKQQWEDEIQSWKRYEMEKNRKVVEKLSLTELYMLHAKSNLLLRKKQAADELKKESEQIMERVIKDKHEELEQKIKMVKEIKILEEIAKKSKAPKVIDFTESSGVGLLCEMSIAELQERLNIIKINLKDELENKKKYIKEQNYAAKRDLEDSKQYIKNYMTEREDMRKQNNKSKLSVDISSNKEIHDLKQMLNEKRKFRIYLTA